MLGKELIGKSFRLDNGRSFKVLKIKPYTTQRISKRFDYIKSIKPGFLVVLPYRGALLPNITLERGVCMIVAAEIDGKVVRRPGRVSKALGIDTYLAGGMRLKEIKRTK